MLTLRVTRWTSLLLFGIPHAWVVVMLFILLGRAHVDGVKFVLLYVQ